MFAALNATPPSEIRVVILGQDPYHGPGQAHGLAFSVRGMQALPPSLRNIFRELSRSTGAPERQNGDLSDWAHQGVLLLNSVLTVERGKPGSHAKHGWERFTDTIVQWCAEDPTPKVFMLWGAYAQRKGEKIKGTQHRVLHAPHPSPLSAHRGFIGCDHFREANAFLSAAGRERVDWT
ncbi:uracil-DNA glycosylase [Luminiphilus syltensis NOR5-1B]|uniref:Uracil-DNA glycosylase n=2 Tax=Luminiphilus TaxID=1341118 RepID=B8KR23_9GAMM|nr:uracil-DNA glycosylase [Luminiphilus syltensis NOR5-1B]